MTKGLEILSDIVVFNKYAKYIDKLKRRETFEEIVNRYILMMLNKYPHLEREILLYSSFIYEKKILPSMRAMQFAGAAIERSESRIYNCAYLPLDDYRAFSELMFLLLGGTGVGYSVQTAHIEKLPEISKPTGEYKYLISDSIEGWADSVRHLLSSYFGVRKTKPRFDFSDIRAKGVRLVTAGGKAPGPEPLKRCLFEIEQILERKKDGDKLSSIDCHDIACHIADAVLSGGIRRAAMICLFSMHDDLMLHAKHGNWWELNPQRGRANNSVVIVRSRITKPEFDDLWKIIKTSGAGEPGIYFTNNADYGTNPCCEISLRPYSFCNLTEINVSDIKDQADLNQRSAAAAFFGTLQAGFTDFHYLRPIWKKSTEKDYLIGVGQTGIASEAVKNLDLNEAVKYVTAANEAIANLIGIKPAARCTTIKPSGTTSCVLGTSSGIHAWHNDYYIRRQQMTKDEALYKYLLNTNPDLIKDYKAAHNSAVLELPIAAPENAITRKTESAIELLERVKNYYINWIKPGHRSGYNTNNVSATISIDKNKNYVEGYGEKVSEKWYILEQYGESVGSNVYNEGKFQVVDEWKAVGEWMWDNKNYFNGLSVLPMDLGTYEQTPFEDITKEQYEEMLTHLHKIDLTQVTEEDDATDLTNEIACSGQSCDITF